MSPGGARADGDRGEKGESRVTDKEWLLIEGRHPVEEALASGRAVREVLLQEGIGEGAFQRLTRLASQRGVKVRTLSRPEFRKLTRSSAPQGVAAWVESVRYIDLEELIARAAPPGLILICDRIVDPHNLGALIRSAQAAGASGVVVPKDRSAPVNETVVKSSAGAALRLPIVRVTNLARSIERLKEAGYWVVGASMDGDRTLWEVDFLAPTAIVIGGEGKGLSRLVAESCDILARIPMPGSMESLNASVAGALFLFEAVRQRSTS